MTASVLVGVAVAAGFHLLWLEPGDSENTSLALDRGPSPAREVKAADVAPSTSDSTTTGVSSTEASALTTTTETTASTSETEEEPESARPTSSSSESVATTTTDSGPEDATPMVSRDGTQDSGDPQQQVVELVNAERAEAGCAPVRVDDRLVASAQSHSDDMAAGRYLSHTSRDGRSFDQRIEDAGYPAPAAENIAMGMSTADAVMQAWMDSEGHRRNILNCDITAIGVGVNSDGWYWTQNFGY